MPSVVPWVLTAAQIFISLVGLATNGFVLMVNYKDWAHSGPLAASDYFICSLAICNICLQTWSGADWLCELFQDNGILCNIVYTVKMIVSSYSLQLTAWLCVFYCVRIVVFHNCLLRWVQHHIKTSYKYFTFFSILLCFALGLPLTWTTRELFQLTNSTALGIDPVTEYGNIYRSALMFFGYAVPLFYVIFSGVNILRSLLIHMRRMRISMEKAHEALLEAHLHAGYTVLSLLLLFFVNFVSSLLVLMELFPRGDLRLFFCYLAIILYSPAHSLVLIRGNGKLRRAAAVIIRKLLRIKD
ncbi:taste receptor type 2 member 40-like [Pelodytes ibericus]